MGLGRILSASVRGSGEHLPQPDEACGVPSALEKVGRFRAAWTDRLMPTGPAVLAPRRSCAAGTHSTSDGRLMGDAVRLSPPDA